LVWELDSYTVNYCEVDIFCCHAATVAQAATLVNVAAIMGWVICGVTDEWS